MNLPFTTLDVTLFRNADSFVDALFSNLNNCLEVLAALRDDLAALAKQEIGAKRHWVFDTSRNYQPGSPSRRGGRFDMTSMYFAEEVAIRKPKSKEGPFINTEYTFDSEEFNAFAFYWQIGQVRAQVGEELLFDDDVLSRLKDAAVQKRALCYTYSQDLNDGMQSIFIGIPVSRIRSGQSILDQHRLFKNTIAKPLLRRLR